MKNQFLNPKIFLLTVIFFLALILRLYHFTNTPPALYPDEAAIGYNAYSILKTGKDEWGKPWPLLFRSFDDYKVPLYIYTVAAFESFLGPTDLAVRLPSAIFGSLTVLAIFYLTRRLLFPDKVNLLAALFLAISPWHLQFTRAGFEASLALFLVTLGTWLFLRAMAQNIWWLLPGLISFSLSTMAYHSSRVFVPLYLLTLFVLFRQKIYQYWRQFLVIILLSLLFSLPYIATWITPGGTARLTTESILNQPGNLIQNIQNNYVANFSFDYFFFHGDQNGRHSVKKLGELPLWQLPMLLIGSYLLIRSRSRSAMLLLFWLLLAAVPPTITRVSPHALRGLLMVVPLTITIAYGTVWILKKWRFLGIFLIISLPFFLALYLHYYYIHYPVAYAADWSDGSGKTAQYLGSVEKNYNQIFIHESLIPIYLLFYEPVDPKRLQQQNHDTTRLGKFQYHNLYTAPIKANPSGKSLIVAPAWVFPRNVTLKREIRMVNGQPVFSVYEF